MKKEYILGILFFSGIWGASEAFLGEALYDAGIPFSSVPLTIIGFCVLAFARVSFNQRGTATLIAALAMLYKFLNTPFFACHLLGILIVGMSFDLFFNVFKIRNRSISAAAAIYLNYTLFALMITYIFRYKYWVEGGFPKVLSHIGISGTMAAIGCAIFVPIAFYLGQRIKAYSARPFNLEYKLAPGGILTITLGLWIYSLATSSF
jgi:hypothetical protein